VTNPPTIDLNAAPAGHIYSVSVKPGETEKDAWARIIKDLVLFFCSIAFIGALAWFCYETMRSSTASAEEKKWSMSLLSLAAGGLIGYLVKK
jgi:hypothetical protein